MTASKRVAPSVDVIIYFVWTFHYWAGEASLVTLRVVRCIQRDSGGHTYSWWHCGIAPQCGMSTTSVFIDTMIKETIACWACESEPFSAVICHILRVTIIGSICRSQVSWTKFMTPGFGEVDGRLALAWLVKMCSVSSRCCSCWCCSCRWWWCC